MRETIKSEISESWRKYLQAPNPEDLLSIMRNLGLLWALTRTRGK